MSTGPLLRLLPRCSAPTPLHQGRRQEEEDDEDLPALQLQGPSDALLVWLVSQPASQQYLLFL
jgi:hypothetical protein